MFPDFETTREHRTTLKPPSVAASDQGTGAGTGIVGRGFEGRAWVVGRVGRTRRAAFYRSVTNVMKGAARPDPGNGCCCGQGTSAAAASPKNVAMAGKAPTTSTTTSDTPIARLRGAVGPVSVSSGIASGAWSNQALFTTRA